MPRSTKEWTSGAHRSGRRRSVASAPRAGKGRECYEGMADSDRRDARVTEGASAGPERTRIAPCGAGHIRPCSTRSPADPLTMHIFSCDVEEHFHVSAFERTVAPAPTGRLSPPRADASTDLLLELLARHGATGTFFVVGWLADRNPELVRRIAAAGHEIATHSWWHRRVPTITREEFREDVARTQARLEEITGRPVRGFRAPSFSILPGMEWAFDVLLETGHTWDSSVSSHSAPRLRLARRPDRPLYDRPAGGPVARDSAGHARPPRDANPRGRRRLPAAVPDRRRPARPPRARRPGRGRDVLHPSVGGRSRPAAAPLLRAHAHPPLSRARSHARPAGTTAATSSGSLPSRIATPHDRGHPLQRGAAEWDAFARRQAGFTHFHLHGWKRVMEQALGHETIYLAARGESGALAGILPLVRVRSAGLRALSGVDAVRELRRPARRRCGGRGPSRRTRSSWRNAGGVKAARTPECAGTAARPCRCRTGR